jgi:hypothetical protein
MLFPNPFSMAWLTGFAPPTQVGPSPFAGGLALVANWGFRTPER